MGYTVMSSLREILPSPSQQPPAWMYYGWYALLMLWMQGNALLHSFLALMALVSIPYYPAAFRRLAQTPLFAWAWGGYAAVRLASTLQADHPWQAWIGIGDDLIMASMALLAMIFIRTREDFIRAAWASFIGFTALGWWALVHQLWTTGSLSPQANVIMGSLESVNFAAVYSGVAMFAMLIALIRLPWRQGWIMSLGLIPLTILQIPFNSRTFFFVFGLGMLMYLVWQRSWRLLIGGGVLAAMLMIGLIVTPGGIRQIGTFKQYETQAEGKGGLPAMQIRFELWKLAWHLSKGRRILGLGPRNDGYVDLNAHRDWVAANMPYTIQYMWKSDPKWNGIKTYDLNHPFGASRPTIDNPHSQYALTLSETGFLGLAALLFLYWAAWRSAWAGPRSMIEDSGAHAVLGLLWIYGVCGITIPVVAQTGGIIFFTLVVAVLALKTSDNAAVNTTTIPPAPFNG